MADDLTNRLVSLYATARAERRTNGRVTKKTLDSFRQLGIDAAAVGDAETVEECRETLEIADTVGRFAECDLFTRRERIARYKRQH